MTPHDADHAPTPTADPDLAPPDTLRVTTLNVWFAATELTARLEAAAAEIRERQPHVVCLQEVLFPADGSTDTAHRLAALCGMRVARATAFSSLGATPGNGGDRGGQAILTTLPVHGTGDIDLPGTDQSHSTRGAVYAWLTAPSGRPALVTTAHLAWGGRYEPVRVQQAVTLDTHIDQLLADHPHPSAPVAVLAGDFNTGPESDTFRFLTGLAVADGRGAYWTDAWQVAGTGDGATSGPTNPWAATTARMVGIADPSKLPDRRIDFVLVRDFVYGRPGFPTAARLTFTAARDVAGQRVVASDHWGVETDLWDPPL